MKCLKIENQASEADADILKMNKYVADFSCISMLPQLFLTSQHVALLIQCCNLVLFMPRAVI